MSINYITKKPSSKGPMFMWTCFRYFGVYPQALLISFWEVVFWTIANCDSHKLWHYRRNLWFVTNCDQGRDIHTLTLRMCPVYLGEYTRSLLTRIRNVAFLPIWGLFHWYICLWVYIRYTGLTHAKLVSLTSSCCSGWPAPMNTPQGQQREAEQRWMRWLQCLIREWSWVNHQFQFNTQIAYEPTYMTHDLY